MKQQQEDYLLAKWLEGKASPEEVITLSKQYDLDELHTLIEANKLLEIDTKPTGVLYEKVQTRIKLEKTKKEVYRRVLIFLSVLIIGISVYMLSRISNVSTIKNTAPGQRDTILFADNTQVILGPSSQLEYDEADFINNRNFNLTGQAYFKVPTKGPLKVRGEFGTVTVLGTEFDVYSLSKSNHRISCYEGKVRVANNESSTYKDLSQGESLTIKKGRFEDKNRIFSSTPDWIRNNVDYNNVSIDEVLIDLSRYFGVSFEASSSMKSSTFNGVVPISSLNECLEYFVTVTGWKYDKRPDSISFYK